MHLQDLPENMSIDEQGILKISGVSCFDLAKIMARLF